VPATVGRPTVTGMPDHHDHESRDHAPHDHAPHDHAEADGAAFAELLDLDGEVLSAHWAEVLDLVQDAATGSGATGPSRILDLGAGTGTGTIRLAQRFDGAEVIAVDVSDEMLGRIRDKARGLGLAERIRTLAADLDAGWPDLEPVDLTWASMSMHHVADPDRVLGSMYATTRPGGTVALIEFTRPLRFLPDDLGFGRPGLEARCLDALAGEHAETLPDLGSDWSPRLAAAGFAVLDERELTIELDAPHPAGTTRYAQLWLERLRSGLTDRLDADDQEALTTLIDGPGPESLQNRDDLAIRGTRTVTLARRP
jgi:SAM-dependent methyltransferase